MLPGAPACLSRDGLPVRATLSGQPLRLAWLCQRAEKMMLQWNVRSIASEADDAHPGKPMPIKCGRGMPARASRPPMTCRSGRRHPLFHPGPRDVAGGVPEAFQVAARKRVRAHHAGGPQDGDGADRRPARRRGRHGGAVRGPEVRKLKGRGELTVWECWVGEPAEVAGSGMAMVAADLNPID